MLNNGLTSHVPVQNYIYFNHFLKFSQHNKNIRKIKFTMLFNVNIGIVFNIIAIALSLISNHLSNKF